MDHLKIKDWIGRYAKAPNLDAVPTLQVASNVQLKFWPFKFAGLLIYGEIAGIKRLPGRVILAPIPVLKKLSNLRTDMIKGYLEDAVDLGMFDMVEFFNNNALLVAARTPWESKLLDYLEDPPTHPNNNEDEDE